MAELGRFGVTFAGNELLLSTAVTARHRGLLATYRMNGDEADARERILSDLGAFLDLGAIDRATDLLIVLALFSKEAGRRDRRLALATSRQRNAILLQRGRGVSQPTSRPTDRRAPLSTFLALDCPGEGRATDARDGDGDDAESPC